MADPRYLAEMQTQTNLLRQILAAVSQKSVSAADGNVDHLLSGPKGDPLIKAKDPRDWSGPSMLGRQFSECPPEYLELLAERYDYFASKEEDATKQKYNLLDARRASRLGCTIARGLDGADAAAASDRTEYGADMVDTTRAGDTGGGMSHEVSGGRTAQLIEAAERADWMQVVLNQGPPCFHYGEEGRFCLRAERWAGHTDKDEYPEHRFVSLAALLAAALASSSSVPPDEMVQKEAVTAYPSLAERARVYMAEEMAMPDVQSDQEQNWIFGHMVTLLIRYEAALPPAAESSSVPPATWRTLLVEADSMLSAAGYGRVVTKDEMIELSARIRKAYESQPAALPPAAGIPVEAVQALSAKWREMARSGMEDPIEGDLCAIARWTMVEMNADELDALLAKIKP